MGTQSRTCNLGGKSDCVAETQICIQVTGYDHIDKPQQIYFYKDNIQELIPANEIALQAAPRTEEDKNGTRWSSAHLEIECPSTLFNWKRTDIEAKKLSLRIEKASTAGSQTYIHLPITDTITAGNDDNNQQFKSNIFLAFIPLAVHDLSKSKGYFAKSFRQKDRYSNPQSYHANNSQSKISKVYYAPARQGYFYIFWNDKLWRELKIEQDSQGKNTYKDIDVQVHRTGENNSFPNAIFQHYSAQMRPLFVREVVGTALDNIWLPYRLSGQYTKIHLLYSEDQLSGERLNYIEKNIQTSADNKDTALVGGLSRLTTFQLGNEHSPLESIQMTTGSMDAKSISSTTWATRIDYLPPTRERDEKMEWRLTNSVTYMTDIMGESLKTKYKNTAETDNLCKAATVPDSYIAEGDFNGLKGAFREFEIDAWHQILEIQYSEKQSENEIWSTVATDTATTTTDVIAEHQKRYILGIAVPDPLNELHHLQTLLDIAQSSKLFSYLAIRASNDSNNTMGHFAYNMSFLYPHIKTTIEQELSDTIKHNYNRSISGAERTYLQNLIGQCQNKMAKLLQQPTTVQAIINLLSNHIPHYYVANLNFMANCFSAISKAPIAYDSIATTITADITEGQVLISELATDKGSPLHKALWPQVSFDDLKVSDPAKVLPEPQPIEGDNKGDGVWHAPALIAIRDWNITNPEQELTNPKLQTFAIQAELQLQGNLLLFKDTLKLGWAGIYNCTSLWLDAIDSTNKALDEVVAKATGYNVETASLRMATAQANKTQGELDRERGILNEDTAKQNQTTRRDNANTRRLTEADKALVTLETRAKATIAKRAGLFNGKEFLALIFQSRFSLPQFKSLGYIMPRQTSARYIAFGDYSSGALDELEKTLHAFPQGRTRKAGTLAEKLLRLLEKVGDGARETLNALNFSKDAILLGIPNATENQKLVAAYADSIDEAFDSMLAKMDSAAKRAEAIDKVVAQRSLVARALWDHRKNSHALVSAKNLFDEAENLLRTAHTNYLSLESQQSAFALKNENFLRGKTIPGIVLFIEVCNITAIMLNNEKIFDEMGRGRVIVGGGSALLDGGFAMALFVERFNGHKAKLLNRALSTEVSAGVLRILGVSKIPIRGFVGAGAMLLTAGIFFWDAVHYYNDNNPAWVGFAMSGTGASVLVYQSLASAALTGPIGWLVLGIGIGLMIAGMFLSNAWDNSNKVKEWFKRGLFAGEITNDKYAHLKDPQQAIYRLLSELIQITIEVEPVNKQQIAAAISSSTERSISDSPEQYSQRLAQASRLRKTLEQDYKVSIHCYFAGLLQSCIFIPYLAKYHSSLGGVEGSTATVTIKKIDEITVHELNDKVSYNAAGMDFYLAIPPVTNSSEGITYQFDSYQWVMQLQIHALPATPTLDQKFWVFPAPKLDDGSEYTPETAAQPVFPDNVNHHRYSTNVNIDNQPFWLYKVLLTSKR